MTLRQLIYRLYLKSPGWRVTRSIRKDDKCAKCKSTIRLELHHDSYGWHNANKVIRWIFPNLVDPMRTLCRDCHSKER